MIRAARARNECFVPLIVDCNSLCYGGPGGEDSSWLVHDIGRLAANCTAVGRVDLLGNAADWSADMPKRPDGAVQASPAAPEAAYNRLDLGSQVDGSREATREDQRKPVRRVLSGNG